MKTLLRWSFVGLLFIFAGCGGSLESGPADAVKSWKDAIVEGKPEVFWLSLPPTYQKDVSDLLSKFADKMDVEIWNTTFSVVQTATSLVKDKKEIFAELVEEKMEDPEAGIEAAADLLDIIVSSDLGELSALEKLDVEKFLADEGARLFQQFNVLMKTTPQSDQYTEELQAWLKDMEGTKIATDSIEGETATVLLQIGEQQPKRLTLVKVEEKWLPKDMVDEWPSFIQQANDSMDEMDEQIDDEQRQMAVTMLNGVEELLEQLSDAGSKEEMLGIAMQGFAGLMGGAGDDSGDAEGDDGDGGNDDGGDDDSDGL